MFGLFHIVRAFLLLRCLFSAEARREFRVYKENTSPIRMALDAVSALIGLLLLGTLAYMSYVSCLIFYHLATTGRAVP